MSRTADRRAWALWLALVAATCVAGGCGSGSSGFDPAAREGSAIDIAAGGGLCEPVDGLVVCGSGATPAPSEAPLGPDASVVLDPASGGRLACATEESADACVFEMGIVPRGFPLGTSFLGAYGVDEKGSSWRGNESPFLPAGGAGLSARFLLGNGTGLPFEAGTKIRLAVLVYLPGHLMDPGLIGDEQALLSAFGADLAYVATDLSVEPVQP